MNWEVLPFVLLEKFVRNWCSFFRYLIEFTCLLGLSFSLWGNILMTDSISFLIGIFSLSVSFELVSVVYVFLGTCLFHLLSNLLAYNYIIPL